MRACFFAFYLLCQPHPAPSLLTALDAGLIAADLRGTAALREGPHFRELDPLARPIVQAGPAAMAAAGYGEAAGLAWLAQRLRRSDRTWLRRTWWVPQAAGIAGHMWGLVVTHP